MRAVVQGLGAAIRNLRAAPPGSTDGPTRAARMRSHVGGFFFFWTNSHPRCTQAQTPRWKMENGRLEPLKMEPPELVKEAEEAEGRKGEPASLGAAEGREPCPVTMTK